MCTHTQERVGSTMGRSDSTSALQRNAKRMAGVVTSVCECSVPLMWGVLVAVGSPHRRWNTDPWLGQPFSYRQGQNPRRPPLAKGGVRPVRRGPHTLTRTHNTQATRSSSNRRCRLGLMVELQAVHAKTPTHAPGACRRHESANASARRSSRKRDGEEVTALRRCIRCKTHGWSGD